MSDLTEVFDSFDEVLLKQWKAYQKQQQSQQQDNNLNPHITIAASNATNNSNTNNNKDSTATAAACAPLEKVKINTYPNAVLLDDNLLNMTDGLPVPLKPAAKVSLCSSRVYYIFIVLYLFTILYFRITYGFDSIRWDY